MTARITINKILVTGAAGFIGSNLVMKLLDSLSPVNIIGIDNMNDYYDVSLKEYRLKKIEELVDSSKGSTWTFIKGNIADKHLMDGIFAKYKPSIVVNLAAQAGVRYSIDHPDIYMDRCFRCNQVSDLPGDKRHRDVYLSIHHLIHGEVLGEHRPHCRQDLLLQSPCLPSGGADQSVRQFFRGEIFENIAINSCGGGIRVLTLLT